MAAKRQCETMANVAVNELDCDWIDEENIEVIEL